MAKLRLIVESEEYAENVGTDDAPELKTMGTRIKVKEALEFVGNKKPVLSISLPRVGDEVANRNNVDRTFWLGTRLSGGWSEMSKSEGAIKVRGEIRDGKIIGIQEMALGKKPIPVPGDIIKGCIAEGKEGVLPERECVLHLRLIAPGIWIIAREVKGRSGGVSKRKLPFRRK